MIRGPEQWRRLRAGLCTALIFAAIQDTECFMTCGSDFGQLRSYDRLKLRI
jgi:hypothetical protein